jgi:flagellar assembly protein FliH
MPVLHQPVYIAQPVSWDWDEKEHEGVRDWESKSPQSNSPISEMALDSARSVKDDELQRARKESYEAGYRNGFATGQQEGYRKGFAEAEQRLREQQWQQQQYVQQLLNNMAEVIRNELETFFSRAEEAVTELALEIAKKVVEVEVKTNPEVVRKSVSQALNELKGGSITVRLNPADFSLLGNDLNLLNLGEGVSVRFVPDETIEQGGVVAESEQGFVDLQPSTKLALLQSEVL